MIRGDQLSKLGKSNQGERGKGGGAELVPVRGSKIKVRYRKERDLEDIERQHAGKTTMRSEEGVLCALLKAQTPTQGKKNQATDCQPMTSVATRLLGETMVKGKIESSPAEKGKHKTTDRTRSQIKDSAS